MVTSDIEIDEQEIRELETKVASLERQLRESREDLLSRKSILSAKRMAKSLENVFGTTRIEADFREVKDIEPEFEG